MNVGKYLDVNLFNKKYRSGPIDISPKEEYMLISIHPNTLDSNDINMNTIIEISLKFKKKMIVFYPNMDTFHKKIVNTLRKFKDNIIFFKHAPISDFTKLMAHSVCMITNSSAGIREAASFGTPVVNVGNRQIGRERNANIIDTQCDEKSLFNAIKLSLEHGKYKLKNMYYQKDSALKISNSICNILENI